MFPFGGNDTNRRNGNSHDARYAGHLYYYSNSDNDSPRTPRRRQSSFPRFSVLSSEEESPAYVFADTASSSDGSYFPNIYLEDQNDPNKQRYLWNSSSSSDDNDDDNDCNESDDDEVVTLADLLRISKDNTHDQDNDGRQSSHVSTNHDLIRGSAGVDAANTSTPGQISPSTSSSSSGSPKPVMPQQPLTVPLAAPQSPPQSTTQTKRRRRRKQSSLLPPDPRPARQPKTTDRSRGLPPLFPRQSSQTSTRHDKNVNTIPKNNIGNKQRRRNRWRRKQKRQDPLAPPIRSRYQTTAQQQSHNTNHDTIDEEAGFGACLDDVANDNYYISDDQLRSSNHNDSESEDDTDSSPPSSPSSSSSSSSGKKNKKGFFHHDTLDKNVERTEALESAIEKIQFAVWMISIAKAIKAAALEGNDDEVVAAY